MYQNYKVNSIVDKLTSQNKPYKACEVQDESGAVFKVNIWSDFPDFANIIIGSVVRAKLEQKGQYWNIISETQGKPRGNFNNRTEQIKETMNIKNERIEKFQDSKEWGMKAAATMRDAVQLAVAEYTLNKQSLDRLDECVTKWRKWLWNNYNVDVKDTDPLDGTLNK